VTNIKQKYDGQTQFQRPNRWYCIQFHRIIGSSTLSDYLYRGGFLLVPHTVEFFQRQHDWMSDRVRFRRLSINDNTSTADIDENLTHRGDNGWVFEQLAA
jgi:hypothetical protein